MASQGYGVGASLASLGASQQNQAMNEYGMAAAEEAHREAANTQLAAQAKAGNMQLGGMVGGLAGGAMAGPWGMVIGGLVGALGGSLFS